ncbi:MAG: primosomal protein N' [Campylobacteraceae bacterium]
MNYYKLSILGSAQEPLTYFSKEKIDIGYIVKVLLSGKECLAVVVEETKKPDFECLGILEKTNTSFSHSQLELAKFIKDYYISSLGVTLSIFTPFTCKDIKYESVSKKSPHLTSNQQTAFEFLQKNQTSLLFGDTGSGKTEIYISLICETLKNKKNAIFLLPEIGLTPQLENRLKAYFGDLIAIWHSKVTKKRKEQILSDISSGKVRVVLGARSALFLPLQDIDLIVVDEEHDDSYKSGQNPRYNARDLALVYAKILNAKVVLGSATPSIVTAFKLPTFRLKGTFFESKKEIIYENENNEITQNILEQIDNTLKNKQQVIVFLPTRAHFKYITCKTCGANIECPYCSVSMSLHKHLNLLKCHYCNFTSRIITICPKCGSETMEATRLGTAEVVDRLRENFPNHTVEKFDRDEITTASKLNKTLNDFKNHKIDILVGTQMLSKGHDYHKVALSVMIGIDSLLAMNDFRAREKALSLAIQIAGRSGRKEEGKVFIQTKNEEFFKVYLEDYDKFIEDEKKIRIGLYPPYKKLLRLLISHKNEKKAEEIMQHTVQALSTCKDIEVVGYAKADISRIANKFRFQILLRCDKAKPLIIAAMSVKHKDIQADIDPLSFT